MISINFQTKRLPLLRTLSNRNDVHNRKRRSVPDSHMIFKIHKNQANGGINFGHNGQECSSIVTHLPEVLTSGSERLNRFLHHILILTTYSEHRDGVTFFMTNLMNECSVKATPYSCYVPPQEEIGKQCWKSVTEGSNPTISDTQQMRCSSGNASNPQRKQGHLWPELVVSTMNVAKAHSNHVQTISILMDVIHLSGWLPMPNKCPNWLASSLFGLAVKTCTYTDRSDCGHSSVHLKRTTSSACWRSGPIWARKSRRQHDVISGKEPHILAIIRLEGKMEGG